MTADPRFGVAIAAIDSANAEDPNSVSVDGVERPRELVHAERVTEWVQQFDPEASTAQLLAARAHHLRRWTLPRSDYPEGRNGYRAWRSELAGRHAADVGEILTEVGYNHDLIERVQGIVTKKNRARDRQVQTHEDALALVFLEYQLSAFAERLGHEATVEVVAKTTKKMSDRALAAANELSLDAQAAAVLRDALATDTST